MLNISNGKIKFKKKISEGSFGSIYLAVFESKLNLDKKYIAVKMVENNDETLKEIKFMKILSKYKQFPNLFFADVNPSDKNKIFLGQDLLGKYIFFHIFINRSKFKRYF